MSDILKEYLEQGLDLAESLVTQIRIYGDIYLDWLPYHEYALLGVAVLIPIILIVLIAKLRSRRAGRALQRSKVRDGRELRKEAQREKKRRNFTRAGELYEMSERYEQAIKMYMAGNSPARAAHVYLTKLKDFDKAMQIYIESNHFESAAKAFASVKNYSEAAKYYRKAGKELTAAEMHERAGEYALAGELYRKHRAFREAARCFAEIRDNIPAAQMYAAYYKELKQTYTDHMDEKKQQSMQEIAKKAAYFYKQAGDMEKCAVVLWDAGLRKYAADVFLSMGHAEKAAEIFIEAGDVMRAADIYEGMGKTTKAAEIKAHYYQSRGQTLEAVRYFEQAGDYLQAADFYAAQNNLIKAGEMYLKGGDSKTAAQMFYSGGNARRAGEVLESVGDYQAALQYFEEAGDENKMTELYEKLGKHFEAGELYQKRNLFDKALQCFSRISNKDPNFGEANQNMGAILLETGKHREALEKLRVVASRKPINADNLELYYNLGVAYEKSGESNFALAVYARIMAINPHFKDIAVRDAEMRKKLSAPSAPRAAAAGANPLDATMAGPHVSAGMLGTSSPHRYEIVKEIGRGGMGVVYLAKDLNLGRMVAYKSLPEDLKHNPQFVNNFVREAKSLAQLSHPYIVSIYDAGVEKGNYFIIMEYVEGENLKDLLARSRKVPTKIILQIFSQLCQALDYAHGKKVVHRDIKTGNIMWTNNQVIKVMDFGLAKVLEEARESRTTVSGTPYYMSPEQTLGKALDHRTDIYSAGISMYELCTGALPFREGDIGYQHIHTQPKPLKELNPEIPDQLNEIILKCLAKDPNHRYQNAREIYLELKNLE